MVLILEIISSLSLCLGSVSVCLKNIKYVKTCCFSCQQETENEREKDLLLLQEKINTSIKNLQSCQSITPRLKKVNSTSIS